MSSAETSTRRAKRLLLWYPKAWRERYGEEFVDHLEQESAERSLNARCVFNIARKGIGARIGDLGFATSTLSAEDQSRAAVATSFALLSLVVVLMLSFWSLAMLRWSSRTYHPIPVSASTGALTVLMGIVSLVLLALVVLVVCSTVRQFIHRQGRPLVVPSTLAAVSGALLVYSVRGVPQVLYWYVHGDHAHPGIGFNHPGSAIAAIAQTTFGVTQNWVVFWNLPHGDATSFVVVSELVPIAVVVFAVSMASLWRRVELPPIVERMHTTLVSLVGASTAAFMVAYFMWLGFGGPSGYEVFVPEGSHVGAAYVAMLGIVVVLVGRARWVTRSAGDIVAVDER
ncbi:MAG: hypothetical protein WCF25_09465 [Acidimicrobiales bacterium]